MIPEDTSQGGGKRGGEGRVPVWGRWSAGYGHRQLKLGSTGGFWERVQDKPGLAQLRGEEGGMFSACLWLRALSHTPLPARPMSKLSTLCDQRKGPLAELQVSPVRSLWLTDVE